MIDYYIKMEQFTHKSFMEKVTRKKDVRRLAFEIA